MQIVTAARIAITAPESKKGTINAPERMSESNAE
jgi:hypothetical protein